MGASKSAAALDWERDGADWPGREASRFTQAAGLRWHWQSFGAGPLLLLIHGTAASTHTWRGVVPLWSRHWRVVTFDLPGHAFTERLAPGPQMLPRMAEAIGGWLAAEELHPQVIIGHSAGAAIAAELCLSGAASPEALVSLNGVLLPMHSVPLPLWSGAARFFASLSFVPRMISATARRRDALLRLVDSTGSTLDERGLELYGRLAQSPAHIAGVLDMLAGWDLESLAERLPALVPRLLLLVAERDRTVSPIESIRVKRRLPQATVMSLPGLGHLAHEERPDLVATAVEDFLERGSTDRGPSVVTKVAAPN
jgi:magnesium chelatase accessory protein